MNVYLRILAIIFLGTNCVLPFSINAQTKQRKFKEINWSVNVSKHKDSIKTTFFNLGLISNLEQQHGAGINLIYSSVHHSMKGFQLSGFLGFNGSNIEGFQIGGLGNIVKGNATGVMLAGLMNATGENASGLQTAGIVNVTGKSYNGLSIAGFMNISSEKMNGIQLSSVLNASGGTMKGAQIALLTNVGVDIEGLQTSFISNISAKRIRGLQLGGIGNVAVNADKALQMTSLINVCLDKLHGGQFALGNYAEDIQGAQVGLINLSTGKIDGWQIGIINHSKDTTAHKIGLININPKTRIQAMFYGGNTSKTNIAIRFKNQKNYSILGIGTHYLDLDDRFSGCLFYRTGLYFPLKKKFEISGDLGYFHIENFENENDVIPERMYSLQARINLEYKVLTKLSIFVSTGYAMTRHYHKNKFFERKAIIEGGIVLF